MFKHLSFALAVFSFAIQAPSAQGLYCGRPALGQFHPLYDEPCATSPLSAEHPLLLIPATTMFRDTTIVDFEKRQITCVRADSLGFIIWTHHYGELNDYIIDRSNAAMTNAWFQQFVPSAGGSGEQEKAKELKLAWSLPVQYPGWAQRVLGNDPPRLSISGSLRLKMAYEDIRRKESSELDDSKDAGPGFIFDEQNQFTVTGSIGRLININISANSEGDVDMNDPLKNFKIEYKESKAGELEDEIVQEVTAGYTGFSMPGTQLSGYSENKEGLFGIKVASKFGPLTLTSIVSNEQGESQKLTTSSSGKGEGSATHTEGQYSKYKYFFLDTAYISHYNKKFALRGGDISYQLPPGLNVKELQVWVMISNQDQTIYKEKPGRTVREFRIDLNGTIEKGGNFVDMHPERHYKLYPKEGWIHFKESGEGPAINENSLIAIYLRTQDTASYQAVQKGGAIDTSGYPSYLWVLKPEQPIDKVTMDPERFRLQWRNVYEISGADAANIQAFIKDFRFSVYYTQTDVKNPLDAIDGVPISDLLGLSSKSKVFTDRKRIFDFDNGDLIIPPYDTSPRGNEPFANPDLKELRDTMVYHHNQGSSGLQYHKPNFTIEMSGSKKQTNFSLGFGVMPKSVRVKGDGQDFEENIDYVVNGEMGTVELISPRALAADKIEIEYERESLFMPERKIFLGMRGEMQLPFISDKSFSGLSILYQNTTTSQTIPRIGQEPFQKFLLDFNTKIDLQPAWMTTIVNKIPLIKTDAQSSVGLEFEIAHSRMSPNTEKTAYVDDFESCKQINTIGEGYRSWHMASPPYHPDSIVKYPPAWDCYWFTPVWEDEKNRVERDAIWIPDTNRIPTGTDKYETVLRLHVRPAPRDNSALKERFSKAWAGIMTPIAPSMADHKRDQYYELLIKCPGGGAGKGRLRIQMGQIREDVCWSGGPPNGEGDREDTNRVWTNNSFPHLDKGIDTVWDEKEKYLVPNGMGGWDTLRYGDNALETFKQDPARDDYRRYNGDGNNHLNYRYACKLEGNYLSTDNEDINNDGKVDVWLTEQYHEFIINLADTTSPYIDRTAAKLQPKSGWRRYRIPLHEVVSYKDTIRREIGGIEPDDWSRIRMIRYVWDGFDDAHLAPENEEQENKLILCGQQFVGNQWEAIRDANGFTKIEVSSINTRESKEYDDAVREAEQKKLILRPTDETNNKQQEGALRLNFKNLISMDEALAQRSFTYQPLDISSYDSLTFILHGQDSTESIFDNDDVRFVFRFGSDSSTYYQYSQTISRGWNNLACINLRKLSDLKLGWFTSHSNDSIDTTDVTGALSIRAPKGRQPNFANIVWMAVGVVFNQQASAKIHYSGELWVNELKVAGIKKFNGWASRLNLHTQWADFLKIDGGLDYMGGDFRTMADSKIAMGDSKLSGNFSIGAGLDKFMPKQWGVSIPVGGSVSGSLVRPQLKPNTDIYLSDPTTRNPDGFADMVKDVINKTSGRQVVDAKPSESEHFETQSFSRSFYIEYSKSGQAPNPAVDLLLNRVSTQFRYNMNTNHTNRGRRPGMPVDSNYVNYDSSQTYSGGLKYDLSPRDPPAWTKWNPSASGAKVPWLPAKLKEIELSMLPEKVDLTIASANYSATVNRQFEPDRDLKTEKKNFAINHGVQIDYTPISPLMGLSYSLSINRDFPDVSLGGPGKSYYFFNDQVIKRHSEWHDYYILERERSRTQVLMLKLNPQLFEWLTTSADYKGDYSGTASQWGKNESTDYMDAKVNSGVNFNGSLTVASLLSASDSSRFGKFVSTVKKGCAFIGFSNVNVTYSAASDLNNRYWGTRFLGSDTLGKRRIGPTDYLAYQMGLKGRGFGDIVRGDMDDMAFGGMRYREYYNDTSGFYENDCRAVTQSCQVSTSLGFTKPIDLQLSSISLRWNKSFTVRPDTLFFDTTWIFPEFTVSARSGILDKIKIINTFVQGMNLSSSFSIKQDKKHSSSSKDDVIRGSVIGMSPLVALDGTVKKWPITFSFQHTMSREKQGGSTEKSTQTYTVRDGDNFDMKYEVPQSSSGLRSIKLFSWSIPVQGRTTLGMRITRDHSTKTINGQKSEENSNFSATPNIAYVFTNNVTGTLEYTGSRVTDMGSVTTTNIIALIADIRF